MTDDGVGYGKPPKHSRFKPGQSGNPRGRPKGRRSIDAILGKLLDRKIKIGPAGRQKHVSIIEAILMQQTNNAVKGDRKAAELIMRWRETLGLQAEDGDRSSDEVDEEIVLQFLGTRKKEQ